MDERDGFSWNTMMGAYAERGDAVSALGLFSDIPEMERGVVSWNSLLDAYVRAGEIDHALDAFCSMPVKKNVVSWSTVIAGCVRGRLYEEALKLFREMQLQRIKPNRVTLLNVLPAVANSGSISICDWVFSCVEQNGFCLDDKLGSGLIDAYSSCGSIDRARQVFERIQKKDIYSWNSMMLALATNGRSSDTMDLFLKMSSENLMPNDVTFVALLKACSHGGLDYFQSMRDEYNIEPDIVHYGCVVDLLGRAGQLRDAQELILRLPFKPNSIIWNSLLGACRVHGDMDLAEWVAEKLTEIDPLDHSPFVVVSNMYASSGRWMDVEKVRGAIGRDGLRKLAGWSSIEVDGVVHEFGSRDSTHQRAGEIYALLHGIQSHSKSMDSLRRFNQVVIIP
ncbi:Pentatricopeptide repeat-containing protein [Acorus calamus]|uniref:Pentatricopeptide repeat-containing protein n=1 Tax=Acorus calamus TaxID=4465 RepID=A0AAV9DLX5_ACOCL|nr:Pentatricopeptide repeat-containing protein [Acorus calamus]